MSNAEATIGTPQAVRVKRKLLSACMTCPLCHKLLRDATSISECLHTFCRKCIFNNLADEDADCCPICNIDLGCVPVEKLRPDHNLQNVRTKVFLNKRRKVNAPEVLPLITLPIRRKGKITILISGRYFSNRNSNWIAGKKNKSSSSSSTGCC